MKSTSSTIILVLATLMGLFFGYILGGWLWAVVLGAISAAGAWIATSRYSNTEINPATDGSDAVHMEDPRLARFLFMDTRSAALWLPLRIFLGWEWFDAGLHKLQNPKWMETGESLQGYWQRAVTIPEQGSPAITYDWWRGFLQALLDSDAHIWFAKVITFGEILIGLGLITGALVGIAAFSGMLMNLSFLLSGSSSTNPIMLTIAFLLVLAWKVAGYIGLDRWLLPALGTPWQKGALLSRRTPEVSSTT